ncbi:MAG TPA: LytTR family DNA-binding domain-containing protein [Salinimicrobium sp.]|nr:LytTR family DNA-binding domain-containing protein [Salinimicrobium sp.]
MKNYIIIDDEPIAHRIIDVYCEEIPFLNKSASCYNAFEAMKILNEQKIDLVFLDINMPKLSGFEFLKTLVNPPKVIVTSAYKDFALEGYELNVSDYLLKPFSFERFLKAVNTLIQKETKSITSDESTISKENSFFVKGDKKQHQVKTPEILFIEAYGNYSKIHLENEMILTHQKISSFEDILASDKFIRVHKSFIVALDKISFVEGNQISIGSQKIPIGQTYKESVNSLF